MSVDAGIIQLKREREREREREKGREGCILTYRLNVIMDFRITLLYI